MNEQLNLITEWDKTFPKSNKVNHKKVTFHNRFGITLVVDMYIPKEIKGKLPGIAVCGPFGAVKEQASGLYAEKMAERGFLTIAFDPSFTGESTGVPRYVASVDINTEDYQAAVDFLSLCEEVDPEKIGIIGICGWGGIALNTASIDTRIKATVCSTMYDMSRVNHNGYFDSMQEDERYELKKSLNAQRIEDYKNKEYKLAGGVIDPLLKDAPFYVKDYYDYYKTNRGYHKRSLNSNTGWNITSALSFINTPQNTFSNEIPITDTIANVNTTSEYCNAKLIVYSLDENILRKPGIPKRHNIVSTMPCITLSPIPIVVALCALFFS